MPNKTIYIRDEDAAMWDEAQELSGGFMSPLIARLLRAWMDENRAELEKMKACRDRLYGAIRDGK